MGPLKLDRPEKRFVIASPVVGDRSPISMVLMSCVGANAYNWLLLSCTTVATRFVCDHSIVEKSSLLLMAVVVDVKSIKTVDMFTLDSNVTVNTSPDGCEAPLPVRSPMATVLLSLFTMGVGRPCSASTLEIPGVVKATSTVFHD